jgi:purine-cytosine permease-like protein
MFGPLLSNHCIDAFALDISVLTTIPIGALGQSVFSLTLPHTIATIMCFTALGCITTAFIATLGPQTGKHHPSCP